MFAALAAIFVAVVEVGWATAPIWAPIAVASTMQRSSQKKAVKSQKKTALASARAAGEIAGRKSVLTEQQMRSEMGRSKIRTLSNLIEEGDRQVYTLPSLEPTSPVERINRAIDNFLRGVA